MSKGFEFPPGGSRGFQPNTGPTPAQTCGLAVASLVFGILSLLVCFIGLLIAPVAILTGHVARSKIRGSGGALTGGGLAAFGLVLGYLSLVSNVGLVGYMATKGIGGRERSPADAALLEAEGKIASDANGFALGNSDQARDLARTFALAMESLHDEAFTKTGAKVKLSGGHYVTWCELRPGRCAFVVHVPEYRRFSPDAKKLLENLAWAAAQKTVQGTLKPGDELAVGMKGVLVFGAVMVGDVLAEGAGLGAPRRRDKDRGLLVPFFADTPAASPKPDGGSPPNDAEKP